MKTLETKAKLKAEQDKIAKLQTIDLSYFCDKSHFEDDGTFHPIFGLLKNISNTDHISAWKSEELYDENIKLPVTLLFLFLNSLFLLKKFIGLISVSTIATFCDSLVFNSKGPIKCVSLNSQS